MRTISFESKECLNSYEFSLKTADYQYVTDLAISPDSEMIAISFEGQKFIVLDKSLKAKLFECRFNDVTKSIDFSPDGKYLAVGVGVEIQFWNVETWQLEYVLEEAFGRCFHQPKKLRYAPDGSLYAVSTYGATKKREFG